MITNRLCVGLLLCLLYLAESCSAETAPVSADRDWPPAAPAQPGRLLLSKPTSEDPLRWWFENVYSLVPEGIYPDSSVSKEAQRFVAATNEKRAAAGLNAVQILPALNRVAQAQAMDEAIRDYWNHRNPEGLGSHDRIEAAQIGIVRSGGENSAVAHPGSSSVERVVDAFSEHEGHRELLFDPDVRFIGIGIFNYSPTEQVHYVQLLVSF